MKNLSKVLAVVLAFAMVLSMVGFAGYTDIAAGDDCEKAVTVLSGLNILTGYEDGSFKPEATITRAEFATIVIRMLGLAETATGGSTVFPDVAADFWANGYIALAAQQGIINGYPDGTFRPEDPVKYEEAIKMVVAALGYTPMADANGGYPGGYQVVAASKGILAGIKGAKTGEPATRGVVAQLGFNALDVPLMEQVGYGTQTNFETVAALLADKLGVTIFEGKVTDSNASNSSLDAGELVLNYDYQYVGEEKKPLAKKYAPTGANGTYDLDGGVTVVAANADVEAAAKELARVASVMYVKDANGEEPVLLCIVKDGNKNKTVSFASSDIKTNAAYVGGTRTFEVWTDADANKYEKYTLADNVAIYINDRTTIVKDIDYNGGGTDYAAGNTSAIDNNATMSADEKNIVDYYLNSAVEAANGGVEITLVAGNKATPDKFDTLYVTTYQDLKVERISTANWKVYCAGDNIVLNEEDENQVFEIYKDGELVSFADIAVDDVLSIAGYKDAYDVLHYGKVYITSDKVEGKVTGVKSGKVLVDGVAYDALSAATSGIAAGDTVVFYVNNRGILMEKDTTASAATVVYGFASFVREYDSDEGKPATMRVLTAEGKWETLNFAKTVKFNGASGVNTRVSSYDWSTVTIGGSNFVETDTGTGKFKVNGVVAYDLNNDGEISKLYTEDATDIFEDESFSGSKNYNPDTASLGNAFVSDATVLFSINAASGYYGPSASLIEDEDLVSVIAVDSLTSDDPYAILAGYDLDDDLTLGAVVGREIVAGVNFVDNFFVVTEDPMQTVNEAGEAGILLTGLKAGEEATLFINTDESVVSYNKADYDGLNGMTPSTAIKELMVSAGSSFTFEKGDVLVYSLDSKGEAKVINVLLEASDVYVGAGQEYNYLSGAVNEVGNTTVLADITVGGTDYSFIFGYAENINGNKITLKDGSASDHYVFGNATVGTVVDLATGIDGRFFEGSYGDIAAETFSMTAAENKGDVVFARAIGSRIEEFVVVANKKN